MILCELPVSLSDLSLAIEIFLKENPEYSDWLVIICGNYLVIQKGCKQ